MRSSLRPIHGLRLLEAVAIAIQEGAYLKDVAAVKGVCGGLGRLVAV
jgi:hypothetical protein